MISTTKRSILRWTHLVLSIPVLGYIYGPISDVQQYAPAVRFVFVPIIILSGLWMYSGILFAVLGVAVWLGVYSFSNPGAAVLSEVALFMVWKAWTTMRARQSN